MLYFIDISCKLLIKVTESNVCHMNVVRVNETLSLSKTLFSIIFHLPNIFCSFHRNCHPFCLLFPHFCRLLCIRFYSVFNPSERTLLIPTRYRIIQHKYCVAVSTVLFIFFVVHWTVPIHLAWGRFNRFWFVHKHQTLGMYKCSQLLFSQV